MSLYYITNHIIGNGTEEIVRNYNDPSRLFFFSIHLYDKDEQVGNEFFPGSGLLDDTVSVVLYM